MIKTTYLGYQLTELALSPNRKTWRAFYNIDDKFSMGIGESPESACASAQKEIKEKTYEEPSILRMSRDDRPAYYRVEGPGIGSTGESERLENVDVHNAETRNRTT